VPSTGEKKLAFDPSAPVRDGVAGAVGDVLAYARSQVEQAAEQPERSVHEYRKSIRRSRSVVKLMRDSLGRETYDQLTEPQREAARETSILRDLDVLLDLVAKAPREGAMGPALDDLEELLREEREALRKENRVETTLREGSELLVDLPDRFRKSLPDWLDWPRMHEALQVSYRRARRARRKAKKKRSTAAVHEWRKRVKELRYQLELLAPVTGPSQEHRQLVALAKELGGIIDLVVLRNTVKAHRGKLPEAPTKNLLRSLKRGIRQATKRALEGSKQLFAPKPADFATLAFQPGRREESPAGEAGSQQ
jgi:CHAD domain-containing protein